MTVSKMEKHREHNFSAADDRAGDRAADRIGDRLSRMLAHVGQPPLDPEQIVRFESHLSLILRWNTKTNLTAIRDEDGILSRHFLESIACAHALPSGLHTLLDFGSGAGFPGIPIAIIRPEIAVTLAESQGKKAAFLREAVRTLGLPAKVHAGRAEMLRTIFDCVVLRAVDRMETAVGAAARLTAPSGWLVLMTTVADQEKLRTAAGTEFVWREPVELPGAESLIVLLGQRRQAVAF